MELLNIAKSNTEPFYIDPSEVSGISVDTDGAVALYNGQGELFRFAASERLNAEDIIKKLAKSGISLIYFPERYDGRENPRYISPAAVTYATISKTTDDDKTGAIIGIKGMGRVETYGATQTEIDILVTSVRAVKTFLGYKPEQAYSRWNQPAALYIDPKAVTQIQGGASQVNVEFENSGRLDIQFNNIMAFPYEAANRQVRLDFANALAAANGTLIALPFPDQTVHIRKEDVGYVSFYDDVKNGVYLMRVTPQKNASNPYPGEGTVRGDFNTAAERLKAFEALTAGLSAKTVKAHKPKPH